MTRITNETLFIIIERRGRAFFEAISEECVLYDISEIKRKERERKYVNRDRKSGCD